MTDIATVERPKASLVVRIAERFGVEPTKMVDTLKATAFKTEKPVTNEQLMALLIVADQYKLNPFTKELFAFPDKGGIVPVVSVDGWARIINEKPQFDGMEVSVSDDGAQCTVTMWRKDRSHPTVITEYLQECKRGTQPWQSHPRRMLRHKAVIQCARIAFGFAGIYDEDEAHRIVGAAEPTLLHSVQTARLRQALDAKPAAAPLVFDAAVQTRGAELVAQTVQHVEADEAQQSAAAFAECEGALNTARDADAAALVLDRARGALPPSEYELLARVYANKFNNQE